jgi:hypothetical protein
MVDGAFYDNLASLIVQSLINYGGYNEKNITNKLVCFGTNGVTIFQGLKFNVTIQLMLTHAPFVTNVHYTTHITNLVVQTLSGLGLVKKLNQVAFFHVQLFCSQPLAPS